MSKINPDYVLRAQLIAQLLLSLDDQEYSVIGSMLRGGVDTRLLNELGVIADEIIKASKR